MFRNFVAYKFRYFVDYKFRNFVAYKCRNCVANTNTILLQISTYNNLNNFVATSVAILLQIQAACFVFRKTLFAIFNESHFRNVMRLGIILGGGAHLYWILLVLNMFGIAVGPGSGSENQLSKGWVTIVPNMKFQRFSLSARRVSGETDCDNC